MTEQNKVLAQRKRCKTHLLVPVKGHPFVVLIVTVGVIAVFAPVQREVVALDVVLARALLKCDGKVCRTLKVNACFCLSLLQ